ncbi:MAG: hypothetical protein V7750_16060 [Sneathiella sp.]
MIIGRVLGWILFCIGLMFFGAEMLSSFQAGEWAPQLLGQLWFEFDSESLNIVQAVVQRYLLPALWDPVILTALLWPTWVIFIIPGILLSLLFRKKDDRFGPKKYLD